MLKQVQWGNMKINENPPERLSLVQKTNLCTSKSNAGPTIICSIIQIVTNATKGLGRKKLMITRGSEICY